MAAQWHMVTDSIIFQSSFSVFFHIILKVQSLLTFAFQFLPKKTNNFFLQLYASIFD